MNIIGDIVGITLSTAIVRFHVVDQFPRKSSPLLAMSYHGVPLLVQIGRTVRKCTKRLVYRRVP